MGYYDYKTKDKRSATGQRIIEKTNDKVFSFLTPHLAAGAEVLDIGAGAGEFARRAIAAGYGYCAVEANENYCAALRQMGAKEVAQAFVPPVPFADGRFDLVYMSHLLEHMTDPHQALSLVGDIRRVLKPDGLICLVVPDFLHDPRLFFDADYTHGFVTSENRLRMLLSDTDFTLVRVQAMAGPFTGFPGWAMASLNKFFSRWCYLPLAALLRPWVNPWKLGKLRTAFCRSIFFLARKAS